MPRRELLSYRVEPHEKEQRLDSWLAAHIPEVSRSRIQKIIAEGGVLLNGNSVKKREIVAAGDDVTIDAAVLSEWTSPIPAAENIPLDIIYEDDSILVVNKPAGLVVHPGSGNRGGTLVNALLYRGAALAGGFLPDRPGIVHRLDKNTSGLLLVAKTNAAHTALAAQFSSRRVEKEYLGFALGACPPSQGCIDKPIGRHRREPARFAVRVDGKPSLTGFRLLRHKSGISLLQLNLKTGRTHQIRVHLANEGMPVVADTRYGGGRSAILRLEPVSRPFAFRIYACFSRQALHARRLCFSHPSTGKHLDFTAALPGDFKAALDVMNVREDELNSVPIE